MRILGVSNTFPITSAQAGSPRAYYLFREMTRRHEVHLCVLVKDLTQPTSDFHNNAVARVFASVHIIPRPTLKSLVGRILHRVYDMPHFLYVRRDWRGLRKAVITLKDIVDRIQPQVIWGDQLSVGQYIEGVTRGLRILDATDAISLLVFRQAGFAEGKRVTRALVREAKSIADYEQYVRTWCNGYVVCASSDATVIESGGEGCPVYVVPNGIDSDYFRPDNVIEDRASITFLGVMNYPPNRDAALYLCKEILPRIQTVVPEAGCVLVGKDPPPDVRALNTFQGVNVTGLVDDVRPFVHRAPVVIVPLRYGTGTKNKVLAALSMGKAVVATPESCAGLDVTPGKHLLVGANADELSSHVVRLFGDATLRRELGLAGRKLVVERYSWNIIGQQLESVLDKVVNSGDRV